MEKVIFSFWTAIAVLAVVLTSCGKDEKNTEDKPIVVSVTVSPATVTVPKGGMQQFSATVDGSKLEEADNTVIWTVIGGVKTGTAINADGELTIALEETATSLTVKATSALDNSKSGTASVTVAKPEPYTEYFGTWRSASGDWGQITISANEVVFLNSSGYGYILNELTWTETNNPGGDFIANYPTGYKVAGTMKAFNGYGNVPKANGNGTCAVGDIALNTYYVSVDKQSIRLGNWNTAVQEAFYGPYNKKLDVAYWQVTWNLDGGAWPANDNHNTKVAKDGQLAAPSNPTKAGNTFKGWYKESSLTNKITFPYEVTNNTALYAKWEDATPSAKLSISKNPGAGYYTSISAQRIEDGYIVDQYNISTSTGTTVTNVIPGTYRIGVTYWACQTVGCMSSGWSSSFSVSKGQTKNISIVGSAVGF